LHEAGHHVTLEALHKNPKLAQEVDRIIQQLKDTHPTEASRWYGLESKEEFLAEYYSNDLFKQWLAEKGVLSTVRDVVRDGMVYQLDIPFNINIPAKTGQGYPTLIGEVTPPKNTPAINWARTAEDGYEVSSAGDARFSALNAKFALGTSHGIWVTGNEVDPHDSADEGHWERMDVSGLTIEEVYQNFVKHGITDRNQFKKGKTGVATRRDLLRHVYKGDITPADDTIFVFGSNTEGRHGAGAAKTAVKNFGAVYGQAEGLQGSSYAIITKDLAKGERSISKTAIVNSIRRMYRTAERMPDKTFKVAYRTKDGEAGLNGYTGREMKDMFLAAGTIPANVQFSSEWADILEDYTHLNYYRPLWELWAKQNQDLMD